MSHSLGFARDRLLAESAVLVLRSEQRVGSLTDCPSDWLIFATQPRRAIIAPCRKDCVGVTRRRTALHHLPGLSPHAVSRASSCCRRVDWSCVSRSGTGRTVHSARLDLYFTRSIAVVVIVVVVTMMVFSLSDAGEIRGTIRVARTHVPRGFREWA